MNLALASAKDVAQGEKKSQEQSDLAVKVPGHAQGEQQSNDSTAKAATAIEVRANAQREQMSSALVFHSSDEEPPAKKLKVFLEDYLIPSPTPLNFVRPTIINNILYEQFTVNLFSSGSSEFSPTPPPKMADKGKGIAQTSEDDQCKQLMPLIEEGGSAPKLPNLK
ncbi:hypothetical protein Tco_1103373 [Tanacetum coccineum]